MSSSQINFYLLPQELKDIELYLNNEKIFILSSATKNDNIEILNSLTISGFNKKNSNVKYLSSYSEKKHFTTSFIDIQNYHSIDIFQSPVIEFLLPKMLPNNILSSGRVYYRKDYYNSDGLLIKKTPEFLSMAEIFFKWLKKNFKNSKIPGFEMFLVSPSAQKWMQNEGGRFGDLVEDESIRKKKNVA